MEKLFKNWLNQFKLDDAYLEKLLALVKNHLNMGVSGKRAEADRA